MAEAYSVLADYYDRLMTDFDYRRYTAYLKKHVRGRGADLCCGTGRIAIALALAGREVIGADVSAAMLGIASRRAEEADARVLWVRAAAEKFDPKERLDFVTCVCDGVNYLSPAKVAETFARVARCVRRGGIFVFDVSTPYKLREIIGNNVFCEDYDDVTYIWSGRYEKGRARQRMTVSFFLPRGELYERIDEEHVQYAHERAFLESLLAAEWRTEVLDGVRFDAPDERSARWIFRCVRR